MVKSKFSRISQSLASDVVYAFIQNENLLYIKHLKKSYFSKQNENQVGVQHI